MGSHFVQGEMSSTWATTTDHTGWLAAVSSGKFAQWLILLCLSSCHKAVNTTAKNKILNPLFDYLLTLEKKKDCRGGGVVDEHKKTQQDAGDSHCLPDWQTVVAS